MNNLTYSLSQNLSQMINRSQSQYLMICVRKSQNQMNFSQKISYIYELTDDNLSTGTAKLVATLE